MIDIGLIVNFNITYISQVNLYLLGVDVGFTAYLVIKLKYYYCTLSIHRL